MCLLLLLFLCCNTHLFSGSISYLSWWSLECRLFGPIVFVPSSAEEQTTALHLAGCCGLVLLAVLLCMRNWVLSNSSLAASRRASSSSKFLPAHWRISRHCRLHILETERQLRTYFCFYRRRPCVATRWNLRPPIT